MSNSRKDGDDNDSDVSLMSICPIGLHELNILFKLRKNYNCLTPTTTSTAKVILLVLTAHVSVVLVIVLVIMSHVAGAVIFGIDPTVVGVRRSRLTYGVGVLHRFVPGKHPAAKKITRDGSSWCIDVFDRFVAIDQEV